MEQISINLTMKAGYHSTQLLPVDISILQSKSVLYFSFMLILKIDFIKLLFNGQAVVAHAIIPALRRQRQADLRVQNKTGLQSELQDSLATQRNTVTKPNQILVDD